ncbi:MAG: Ig-like domain-containing protein [Chthoniobacteraceae bacterium]|jgi:hypothetical protein
MKARIPTLIPRTLCLAVLLLFLGLGIPAARAQYAPPNAVNDDVVLTGTHAVTFDPLANDSDPNSFPLTITSVSQPSLGNVSWTGSSVTYTPHINFEAFAGADAFTYTISDGYNTATAQIFVGNPFYLQKGNFAGTLNNPGGGYVTMTTTLTGVFTGKLRLPGLTYNLLGTFSTSGSYSATIGGKPLTLQFDVANLTGAQFGQYAISGSYNGVGFTAYHALYNSISNPAPEVGYYTMLLPAVSGSNPAVPSGSSFGVMDVTEAGYVTIVGYMSDGIAFTDGVFITGGTDALSNNFPLYVSLAYKVPGSITGSLTFENIPGISDCDGQVTWMKPAQAAYLLYPTGFTTTLTAVGARYIEPPLRTLALNLPNTTPNASVSLTEPNFDVPIYHQLSITTTVRASVDNVSVINPGADKFTLSIAASTGIFTGSFIDPLTGKLVGIKGVLLYKQTRAAGFFLSPTQSGNVGIWPAENE